MGRRKFLHFFIFKLIFIFQISSKLNKKKIVIQYNIKAFIKLSSNKVVLIYINDKKNLRK